MFPYYYINPVYVLISIAICISTFVLLQKNKRKSKLLLLPISNFILASLLQIFDILGIYGQFSVTKNVDEVFRLYFLNDSVMVFGFCYIPSIVFGTVIPLVAIAIFALKQKKNN